MKTEHFEHFRCLFGRVVRIKTTVITVFTMSQIQSPQKIERQRQNINQYKMTERLSHSRCTRTHVNWTKTKKKKIDETSICGKWQQRAGTEPGWLLPLCFDQLQAIHQLC